MRQLRPPSRFAALVFGLSFVAVACGASAPASPSPTSTPAPTEMSTPTPTVRPTATPTASPTPEGSLALTGRIEVAAEGYALTLPDGWYRAALSEEELLEILEAGADAMPEGMSELMAGQIGQMTVSGMSLMAFRVMTEDIPLGTSVNVVSTPSLGLSFELMEGFGSAQLAAMLGLDVEIETERITLPAGEALLLTYVLPIVGPPAMELAARQYLLIGATKQYIVSCTTPGKASALTAECDAIAESFAFLP
ncbi:MAG TPA: hypothetical protein VFO73_08745 [Candidatus Limnocylindrales bacterium]|nr:hypothetical protein [Candidatus Limnocylindrales bacterium]